MGTKRSELTKKVSCIDDSIGERELFFDDELAELKDINGIYTDWHATYAMCAVRQPVTVT